MKFHYKILFIIFVCIFIHKNTLAQVPDEKDVNFSQVKVSILGTYHMANPNQDAANIKADDVTSEKRQNELETLSEILAKFKPDKIAIEGAYGNEHYQNEYLDFLEHGNIDGLNRNERQQIGFRLAKKLGHERIYPIDHVQTLDEDSLAILMNNNSGINQYVQEMLKQWRNEANRETEILQKTSIPEFLTFLNKDNHVQKDHISYLKLLHLGEEENYGGADLVASWYKRNFYIFQNLTRITNFNSDEKILVIYGAGHLKILQDLIKESPYYEYISIIDYL